MSWQEYIDSSLVGSGNVDKAAIFSDNGKDSWARSADFKIKPEEMTHILNAFKDGDAAFASGIHVDGEKYNVIDINENSILTKKGKAGLIIVKTTQALILAHHPDTVMTNHCVKTVEALAEYLKGRGY